MTTRRGFMAGLLAAGALPQATWGDAGAPVMLGAARDSAGAFGLAGLDSKGRQVFHIPLPARGHAAAAHPIRPEAVAFARRPGIYALVIDCATGHVAHEMQAPAGQHFYGHGVFVARGDILCTTENHIDTGEGRIGFWSRVEGYRRIGEMPSGGVGPHDVRLLACDVLVVANGGIRTHPDHGRDRLNIPDMRPNLFYLSLRDRAVVERVDLPPELHLNSIRHLAVGPDGQVAFAMQWQGDVLDPVPLLGLHRRGGKPVLAQADMAEQMAMRGYAGSIAFDGAGQSIGITSPRGGRLHVFDTKGAFKASHKRHDICALASGRAGFVASDGMGAILSVTDRLRLLTRHDGQAWDNHLVRL